MRPDAASGGARCRHRLRGAAAVMAATLAAASGCDGGGAPIPSPDLGGAEPLVTQRIAEARSAVERDCRSLDAWARYAMVLHAHDLVLEAAACYREVMRRDGSSWKWPYLLGTLLAPSDPAGAISAYEKALSLGAPDAVVHYRLGDALRAFDRAAEARRQYELALALEPGHRKAMIELAALDMRDGRLDAARAGLERAARIEFRDRSVHSRLAELYGRLGERDRARRESLLTRAYPDQAGMPDATLAEVQALAATSNAMWTRAVAAMRRGDFVAAERAFRLVISVRGESAQDLLNLASALVRQGRSEEGIRMAARAIELEPGQAEARSNVAGLLIDAGRTAEARVHAVEAIRLDPSHDGGHYHLGVVHERQGRLPEATREYATALELNPVNGAAHAGLARRLEHEGRAAEALQHWRDAVEFGPPDQDVRHVLASRLAASGRFAEARDVLDAGLRESPGDRSLIGALIAILATCPDARCRDGPEAVRLGRRLIELQGGRDVPSLGLLAAAHAESGRFAEAAQLAEEALRLAQQANDAGQVAALRAQIALYRAGRPFHQRGGERGIEE